MKKTFIINESAFKQLKHKRSFLYHATTIEKLKDIEKFGLLPQFGETLQGVYGSEYNFSNKPFQDDEDYDQPVSVPFPGILFFSEEPSVKYSQFFADKIDFNKILVCVVLKNDTIFHNIGNEKVVDYEGKEVLSIRYNKWDYINVQDLPIFIEASDWFSLDEQDPLYLLYGDQLKLFLQLNFPNELKKISI